MNSSNPLKLNGIKLNAYVKAYYLWAEEPLVFGRFLKVSLVATNERTTIAFQTANFFEKTIVVYYINCSYWVRCWVCVLFSLRVTLRRKKLLFISLVGLLNMWSTNTWPLDLSTSNVCSQDQLLGPSGRCGRQA